MHNVPCGGRPLLDAALHVLPTQHLEIAVDRAELADALHTNLLRLRRRKVLLIVLADHLATIALALLEGRLGRRLATQLAVDDLQPSGLLLRRRAQALLVLKLLCALNRPMLNLSHHSPQLLASPRRRHVHLLERQQLGMLRPA